VDGFSDSESETRIFASVSSHFPFETLRVWRWESQSGEAGQLSMDGYVLVAMSRQKSSRGWNKLGRRLFLLRKIVL
jgi:hypothetical protein